MKGERHDCQRLMSGPISDGVAFIAFIPADIPFNFGKNQSMTALLRVATEDFPESFDPAASTVAMTIDAAAHTLYNRLFKFKRGTTQIEPSLVERWSCDEEGRHYTFSLRENVMFHKNELFTPSRPLNAHDVVFTFTRLAKRPTGTDVPSVDSPYARSIQLDELVEDVRSIDDRTVQFTLSRPHSPFLSDLATAFASIQSLEYAQELTRLGKGEVFNLMPIGTGPFMFESSRDVDAIRYRAHGAYFEGPANISILDFKIGRDPAERVRMLAADEVDIALYPNPRDIATLSGHDHLEVLTIPSLVTSYLAFNFRREKMRHPALRQALCCAVDRHAYLHVAHHGNRALIADGPLPPGIEGALDMSADFAFDLDKARWLVQEHGLHGLELEILSRGSRSTVYPEPERATEFFLESWSKIGIRGTPTYLDVTDFYRQRNRDTYDVALCGWTGDNGDPDNFFSLLATPAIASGMNYAGFSDPEFDRLIQAGRTALDETERAEIYADI